MRLHELYPFPEERKQKRRIGRGQGSGWGCTSGKGNKGQNSRSGGGVRPGFEGGQMPLARRLPKRGFKNPFRSAYAVVNISRLVSAFEGKDEIGIDDIYDSGLVKRGLPIKVLGDGELKTAITITAHSFSKSAQDKISQAGGTAKALEG